MSILQSILLGIVQGITEFLPVSSSGHLAILQNIFHVETDGGMLFDIMLHIGTLVAIFIVYYKDIWRMIVEALSMCADICSNIRIFFLNRIHKTSLKYKKIIHNNYRKFVVLILVSTVPTGVIGIIGKDIVEQASNSLLIPGICLLITGVLLLIADLTPDGKKMPRHVSYPAGLLIGAAQGLATLPGLSRSGTTIAVCLLLGLERKFAVKYSFILSIPAVLGAAVLEIGDVIAEPIEMGQIGIYAVGMLCAAVVGYVCIRTMLVVVRNKKFRYFSYYCFAVGVLAIVGYFVM
jgi:undecaprenyl-diphosphatase